MRLSSHTIQSHQDKQESLPVTRQFLLWGVRYRCYETAHSVLVPWLHGLSKTASIFLQYRQTNAESVLRPAVLGHLCHPVRHPSTIFKMPVLQSFSAWPQWNSINLPAIQADLYAVSVLRAAVLGHFCHAVRQASSNFKLPVLQSL